MTNDKECMLRNEANLKINMKVKKATIVSGSF